MIVTGIISGINKSSGSFTNNKYSVQIDYFKTPGDVNTSHYTFDANCSTIGGLSSDYAIGDKVYIDFVYDKYGLPVIIGKIYQGDGTEDEARGYLHLGALTVDGDTVLPKTIKIGDLTYDDLKFLVNANHDFENAEFLIGQDKQILSSGIKLTKDSDEWDPDERHVATTAAIASHLGSKIYSNFSLSEANFKKDIRFSEEKYIDRADIPIADVTEDQYVQVTFSLKDAISGLFAPVCESKNGYVSIWATEATSCIVDTIIIWESRESMQ